MNELKMKIAEGPGSACGIIKKSKKIDF